MKVELTMKGKLIVSTESHLECYALERWINESLSRSIDESVDIIRTGIFVIENQNGNDMVAQLLDNNK